MQSTPVSLKTHISKNDGEEEHIRAGVRVIVEFTFIKHVHYSIL